MKIWIMRHSEAGFNAPSDSERTLTEQGRTMALAQGKRLGKSLLEQNIQFDKIIVSPYVRTQETLHLIEQGVQAVGFSQSFAEVVETWEGVTPDGDPQSVQDYLYFLREEGAKNVFIVSHLPLVFDLVQQFTQFQESVHFYPAVIAQLEWLGRKGKVQAVEKP